MVEEFIEDSDLFRCVFTANVIKESKGSKKLDFVTIQCANELKHVGDHLIVVSEDELTIPN